MAFEKYFLPDNSEEPKMAVHLFMAILSEFLHGDKTAKEARQAIESHLRVTLNAAEMNDISGVSTYIKGGADNAKQRIRLDELYRVIILAEHDVWYNTRELLKIRLDWN